MNTRVRVIFSCAVAALAAISFAQEAPAGISAKADADAIMRAVDEREGSDGSDMRFTMKIDAGDGSSPREYEIRSRENRAGDSFMEFMAPRTVKGMRILSVGNGSWVYFPSTGRVRKIGGSARSGSVQGIGGDFSYEDLGGGALADEYDFTLLGESEGEWSLEGTRRDPDSAYDAIRVRVSKTTNLLTFCEFSLASKGGYFKALELSSFTDFGGRLRASKMVMRNRKGGSSTEVTLNEARFGIPEDPSRFDPSRLDK